MQPELPAYIMMGPAGGPDSVPVSGLGLLSVGTVTLRQRLGKPRDANTEPQWPVVGGLRVQTVQVTVNLFSCDM